MYPSNYSCLSDRQELRGIVRRQFQYSGVKVRLGTDVAEMMDALSDANDVLLERIAISLDEAAGIKRDVDPILLAVSEKHVAAAGSWNNFQRGGTESSRSPQPVKLLTARNVMRPQLRFQQYIDNSLNPFAPRLTEKPHALKPLSVLVEYDEAGEEQFSQPYLFEQERDLPTNSQLTITVPVKPADTADTKLVWVDTEPGLASMIADLSKETVIGLDLEAHNYRSYLGITCLIQVSSTSTDYLLDPFPLWGVLTRLNEITAHPGIVKVMHGCDSDVDWLQRDFSVYLRNVFDTHQAGKLLGLPRLSLAWLLQQYCAIEADKQFQLADWRVRPLPAEMVKYARQDTHYLIYLYTRLKNELIGAGNSEGNLVHACLHQSNDICRKRYRKPERRPDSHLDIVRRARANLNNKQLSCLAEVYVWRDKLGRAEDESVHYVLPNHMMLKICTELPREMQGILACCNPVPPLVKQSLATLHSMVLAAREKELQSVDPSLVSSNISADPGDGMGKYESEGQHCSLDLSHLEDSGQLDTIVTNNTNTFTYANNNLMKEQPDLVVFSQNKSSSRSESSEKSIGSFVSPFQRYTLLQPYLQSLDQKVRSKEEGKAESKVGQENLRLDSITKHFEKLTEMTPKRAEKKNVQEEVEENDVVESSDDDVEPKSKKPYFEDPNKPYVETNEKVPKLRQGLEKSKKNNFKNKKNKQHRKIEADGNSNSHQTKMKRKSGDLVDEASEQKIAKVEPKQFDYNQVNFKKFGSKNGLEDKSVDPNAVEKENGKKGAGKKKQQFHKRGNKSHTFKKS